MKKNYFLGAAAAFGLFAFSSCSSDNDPISKPELMTGDQVIVLDMQDTDVLSTKSRPLYSTSNKGAEQVTDVQLLVFGYNSTSKQYEYVKRLTAISNWNNTSADYSYGRKKELKLTGNDKLAKTDPETGNYSKYIILAVGQDESDTNAIPAPFKIELGAAADADKFVKELADGSWTANTPWNVASSAGNGFLKTADVDYNTTPAGEIFSGVSTPIEFTADGGFSTTVLLKRQVAGVMGYFSRIPSKVDGNIVTGIRLVSAVKNKAVDLSVVLEKQKDDTTHELPGDKTLEKVVNGFNAIANGNGDAEFKNKTKAHTVYKIDLKDWFKWDDAEGGKWHNDALITTEDGTELLGNVKGWHNALDASNSANVTVADGAVFAGNFVIPFANNKSVNAENNTFELQLINETTTGGNTTVNVLKAWDVKLDPQSQGEGDGDKVYSVYRNHLYQIGKRGSGDTPTNPGVDPDKPQPLDKDQELIIKINDQWEFIHDMEIE